MKIFDLSGLPPARVAYHDAKDKRVRAAIVKTWTEAQETQSSVQRNHCLGVIRGLVWALTGDDIPPTSLRKSEEVLRLAGIPFHKEDDLIWVSENWLLDHNLESFSYEQDHTPQG